MKTETNQNERVVNWSPFFQAGNVTLYELHFPGDFQDPDSEWPEIMEEDLLKGR